jgi:hypothetical protein
VKGIIFNLVEDVVRQEHGDLVWDDVVEGAGVAGAYTSLGTYADGELDALASSAGALLGAEPREVVRHVAHEGVAILAARYPEFFTPYPDLDSFLAALNTVIHPEVASRFPGAVIPELSLRAPAPGVVELIYSSERRRCDMAEGLLLGAGEHYAETVQVVQTECMRRGDSVCVLRVSRA